MQRFSTKLISLLSLLAVALAPQPASAQEHASRPDSQVAVAGALTPMVATAQRTQRGQSGASRGSSSRGSSSRGSASRGSSSRGQTSRGSSNRGSSSRGQTSRGQTSRGQSRPAPVRPAPSRPAATRRTPSRPTATRSSGSSRSSGTSGARTPRTPTNYNTSNPGAYRGRAARSNRPSSTNTRGAESTQPARGEAVAPRSIYRGRADSQTKPIGTAGTPNSQPTTRTRPRANSGSLFPRAHRPATRPSGAVAPGKRGIDVYRNAKPLSPGKDSRTGVKNNGLSTGRVVSGSIAGARTSTRSTSSGSPSSKSTTPKSKSAPAASGKSKRSTKSRRKSKPSFGKAVRSDRAKVQNASRIAGDILRARDAKSGRSIIGGVGSQIRPSGYSGRGFNTRDYNSGYSSGFGYYDGYGCDDGYGYGNWWWGFGSNCGFSSCWGWSPTNWWSYGCYLSGWNCWFQGYWRPTYYRSYVTTKTVYETIYVDAPVQEAVYVGDAVAPAAQAPLVFTQPAKPALSLAAERYLSLGDTAFREGRYSDAVQAYSKAIEYAPAQGALYLLLADALFAAGDYHYAAYAIRRAYELEPELLRVVVDKHAFYSDPATYDRQLAVLEQYVLDRADDRDARLVLALNYLFGGRPAACVDLLRQVASQSMIGEAVSQELLETATIAQYGAAPALVLDQQQ